MPNSRERRGPGAAVPLPGDLELRIAAPGLRAQARDERALPRRAVPSGRASPETMAALRRLLARLLGDPRLVRGDDRSVLRQVERALREGKLELVRRPRRPSSIEIKPEVPEAPPPQAPVFIEDWSLRVLVIGETDNTVHAQIVVNDPKETPSLWGDLKVPQEPKPLVGSSIDVTELPLPEVGSGIVVTPVPLPDVRSKTQVDPVKLPEVSSGSQGKPAPPPDVSTVILVAM